MLNFVHNQNVFIVAEVSANHNQNFNRAVNLIKSAKECGADAVKFQTYKPENLTLDIDNKYFRIKNPHWDKQTLYQLYKKACTPWNWFKKLKQVADELGIIFFSTAFDKAAVDLLEEIEVPIHKIASFELVDLPLIEYVAKTKKPLMMSTGMVTISEIKEAIDTAKKSGTKDIILLKCTSNYPTKPEEMNLKTIPHMRDLFGLPVGLSDHTLEIETSVAAVSLGAKVIEKHFTLSRRIKTPDSFFSIEPRELKELETRIRIVEKALGKVHYPSQTTGKENNIFKRRRSLFCVKDIKAGEIFTEENVRSIRPGYGLCPKFLNEVLGQKAKRDIKRGTPLDWKSVRGE